MVGSVGDIWAYVLACEVDASNNFAIGKVLISLFIRRGEQVHLGVGSTGTLIGTQLVNPNFTSFFVIYLVWLSCKTRWSMSCSMYRPTYTFGILVVNLNSRMVHFEPRYQAPPNQQELYWLHLQIRIVRVAQLRQLGLHLWAKGSFL